jgi:hypothetical protein
MAPVEPFFLITQLSIKIYVIVVTRMSKLWLMPHYLQMLIMTGMSKLLLMPRFSKR